MRGKLRDKGSINKRDPFHNNVGEQRRSYKRGPRTADWIDQQIAQLDEDANEDEDKEEENSIEEPAGVEQLEVEPIVKIVAKK